MGDLAGNHRVLVVDDCTEGALTLATLIRLLGHDVRTSHDGVEAVAVGTRFRPDVVLLDIGLPGLDGYEVARRLRAQSWGASVTLIALTGAGLAIDEPRLRSAGFNHNLAKPLDIAALVALIGESVPPAESRVQA